MRMNKRGAMGDMTLKISDIIEVCFWLLVFGAVTFAVFGSGSGSGSAV
jgi:hypothetical protein